MIKPTQDVKPENLMLYDLSFLAKKQNGFHKFPVP